MILLFLGSWRSTLIIAISIPLSILTSIIVLSFLHETINIMTLGGLALAVGILVDDATVEIENVNRNLDEGKEIEQAILDGASQIAVPALVSTLCICIVFLPMFFLSGVARYLFVPLAEAVVFAMLASYGLSRTLVPTLAKYLLKLQHHGPTPQSVGAAAEGVRTRLRPAARRLPGDPGCAGAPAASSSCRSFCWSAFRRSCFTRGWVRISSRLRTPASSNCTCAPRPARASKRRRASATWWSSPSGARSRTINC